MDSIQFLKSLYGEDPFDVIYSNLIETKHLLPEQFIIHKEYEINVEEDDKRKIILDGLLTIFQEREEYEKCSCIHEIQKQLKLE